jgi:hypothetical protein
MSLRSLCASRQGARTRATGVNSLRSLRELPGRRRHNERGHPLRPADVRGSERRASAIDRFQAEGSSSRLGGATRMGTMGQFDHILNWKLKQGSHPFPGKDGGTCINEAALVAAGFPYRPIRQVEDMPDCFSRPICRLAMHLNDRADDAERQHLLPFVTRLACADTPEVECKRGAYIEARSSRSLTFSEGVEILEGALRIGRQADDVSHDEVRNRMEAAKCATKILPEVPDTTMFAKLKGWLAYQ